MGLFDFFKDPDVEKMQHNNDVNGMMKALKHNKTVIRVKAAKALGSVSDESAIDPLIKCLNDQSWDVQINAAKALAFWSSKPNLPAQAANKISSAMSKVNRPLAEFYEIQKGLPEVFSEIKEDLKATFRIAKILKEDRAKSNQHDQCESVSHSHQEKERKEYRDCYGKFFEYRDSGDRCSNCSTQYACKQASGADLPERHEKGIPLSEGSKPVEYLISALEDNDWGVRYCAAFDLVRKKDPRAVEPLITVLKNDKVSEVRRTAAEALGELKDTRAVESLIVALKDQGFTPGGYVNCAAAEALGKIKDPRAIEPLVAVISSDNLSLQKAAAEALAKLGKSVAYREKVSQERVSQEKVKVSREKVGQEDKTCDKAIHYMKKFKYYENVPGGMPNSVRNDLYDFIRCIEEMSDTAIRKKREGILIPKEIQIIKDIYEMRLCYAEILAASKHALEKFGGYF